MDSELLLGLGAPNLLLLASEFCLAAQQNSKQQGISTQLSLYYQFIDAYVVFRKHTGRNKAYSKGKPLRDTEQTIFFTVA
jgi:hypothetical protein